ncbi:MAG: ribosome assembly RNA-binding protein YhbY [Acidobacteria bacterium]|nr:ribosome assembly RNA-binding protein YhbY [Acidobacteriota bacterium]
MEVTVESLTTKQRAHLRALAHPLKPIVHIGKEGVTDSAVRSVELALTGRELIKIKVLDTAPESARNAGDLLAERVDGGHLVQVIGRTVVLYKRDPEKPSIKFPRPV